jgi:hypothetical protein
MLILNLWRPKKEGTSLHDSTGGIQFLLSGTPIRLTHSIHFVAKLACVCRLGVRHTSALLTRI